MGRNSQPETFALESLREGTTDSRAAQRYYDDLAASYDETVAEWQYRAPEDASEILVPHLAVSARILDVGCGTGLLASTLRRHGDYVVDGIDISAESLHRAEGRAATTRCCNSTICRICRYLCRTTPMTPQFPWVS